MTALFYLLSFLSGALAAYLATVIAHLIKKRRQTFDDEHGFMAIVRY